MLSYCIKVHNAHLFKSGSLCYKYNKNLTCKVYTSVLMSSFNGKQEGPSVEGQLPAVRQFGLHIEHISTYRGGLCTVRSKFEPLYTGWGWNPGHYRAPCIWIDRQTQLKTLSLAGSSYLTSSCKQFCKIQYVVRNIHYLELSCEVTM